MDKKHIKNRDKLINFIKSDLVGPMKDYEGLLFTPIDTNQKIIFNDRDDANKLFCDKDSGEEILFMWDNAFNPLKTYSAGILYPVGATIGSDNEKDEIDDDTEDEIEILEPVLSSNESEKLEKKVKNLDDDQQIDVSAVNERKPSAIALSFRFSVNEQTMFKAKFSGAAYEPIVTYETNRQNKKNIKDLIKPTENISNFDFHNSSTWWVCMNNSYETIMSREQLFADASENAHWGNLTVKEMKPGDIVLGYTKKTIKTISVVTSSPTVRENFLGEDYFRNYSTESSWSRGDVPLSVLNIQTFELAEPIHVDDISMQMKLNENKSKEKYTTFTKKGIVNTHFASKISKEFEEYLRMEFQSCWPISSPWGIEGSSIDNYEYNSQDESDHLHDDKLWKVITEFESSFTTAELQDAIGNISTVELSNDKLEKWLTDMVSLNNLSLADNKYSITNSLKKFKTFFVRRPFEDEVTIEPNRFLAIDSKNSKEMGKAGVDRMYLPEETSGEFTREHFGIKLKYSFYVRRFYGETISDRLQNKEPEYIATVVFENTSPPQKKESLASLFQAKIEVNVADEKSTKIKEYPSDNMVVYQELNQNQINFESKLFEMLYSSHNTYAIGHGTAVNWNSEKTIFTETMPVVKLQDLTPDILNTITNTNFDLNMLELSELDDYSKIEELLEQYSTWISRLEKNKSVVGKKFEDIAEHNIQKCLESHRRMKAGLELIKNDDDVKLAFQLANKAMHDQQLRPSTRRRATGYSGSGYTFEEKKENKTTPKWRPFQIGFILQNIESIANEQSEFRDNVDLLWFPTGGGKTEAYLGLTAFTLFYRRIKNPLDSGTGVITRYTLRLLTAQQFERSAKLICSMEKIRLSNKNLGETKFSIGIWVGGNVTPNRNSTNSPQSAKGNLQALKNNKAKSMFILQSCPWCGAEIGRPHPDVIVGKNIAGIKKRNNPEGVTLHCPDLDCSFSDELPVFVVDEDIYNFTPSFLVATVDKFALIPWKGYNGLKARSIFGFDENGERVNDPPTLIIQDELHLISDTLGTSVGFNEIFIESFCSKNLSSPENEPSKKIKPKIICSTATIRNSSSQILGLYGREKSSIFPSSGLNIEDSFFSIVDNNGEGKAYVGIYTPALTTQQTQTNIYSSLYQGPKFIEDHLEQDPWWTNICYFGSMRELGTSWGLITENVSRKLQFLHQKYNITKDKIAYPPHINSIQELTSRLASADVVSTMEKLSISLKGDESDKFIERFVLATSIIEVGIDIPRLSLMTILNQPKNTSQYIQTSGRVGRSKEKPGLIFTVYSPLRPRDRSHYEKFTSYHQRLHSLVEPTSVTPFSDSAISKLINGAFFMYLGVYKPVEYFDDNQFSNFPEKEFDEFSNILRERRNIVIGETEISNKLETYLDGIKRRWNSFTPITYSDELATRTDDGHPLILQSGDWREAIHRQSFLVPLSMRSVDKTASAEIISPFEDFEDSD